MIIPLGHEQTSVRRLPWVTFGIMALCTLILVLISPGEHQRQMVGFIRLHQALGYYTQHPYLEIDPRFRRIFVLDMGEEQAAAFTEFMRESGPRPPRSPARLQAEQQRLDGLVEAYYKGLEESILYRFGLVPDHLRAANLITYAFLHTGWIHLFFNLLMLFVIAPFVEDVWGRPLFAGFFLAAAAFAGIMFAIRYPDVTVPLVGASGAIAGVMGAFLVRYLRSRLRFVLWLIIPVGPFQAPAWVILPIWFLVQLLSAQSMDASLPDGGGGAVAFWAHVWGFLFGVVSAVAVRYFRIEEHFIDSAIERKVTLLDNPTIEQALGQARSGDVNGALEALERELAEHPENVDAAMAAWNLAADSGQTDRAVAPMLRAIRVALRNGDNKFVLSHWEELLTQVPDVAVEAVEAVRIAEVMEQEQRSAWAIETLDLAAGKTDEATPAALVLRMARLALATEHPDAEMFVRRAMSHPDLPREAVPELEVAHWALTRQRRQERAAGREDHGADSSNGEETVRFTVTTGIPLALDGSTLSVDLHGRVQAVDLKSVKAVAAAVLGRPGRAASGILDLLVEVDLGRGPTLRCIRIVTDAFDPRTLVEENTVLDAFRELVCRILETTTAVPLPDGDAARGQPFQSYPSIEAYEQHVLGIGDAGRPATGEWESGLPSTH